MRLTAEDSTLIGAGKFEGVLFRLEGRLDKTVYARISRILEAAGGKWNRRLGAHQFTADAKTALEPVLSSRSVVSVKQQFGAFFTPPDLAQRVAAMARLKPGLEVLEPSAGHGALATVARDAGCHVDCVELNAEHAAVLRALSVRRVDEGDFLARVVERRYDRVLMNPPFTKRADVAHVEHAAQLLKPAGILVAIMASGVLYRSDKATLRLRTLSSEWNGSVSPLPEGSFRSTGTDASTCVLIITRPAQAEAAHG